MGPVEEPLTIEEAKVHLNVDQDLQDSLIAAQIVAARRWIEAKTNCVFVTQTWRMRLQEFPSKGPILLHPSPLQSVTSVSYVDINGSPQPWPSSNYIVSTDSVPGRLSLAYGCEWPDTQLQADAVTINYVVGYGIAAMVPEDIKQAMKLQIGDFYANREASITGTSFLENPAACALLEPYTLRYLR